MFQLFCFFVSLFFSCNSYQQINIYNLFIINILIFKTALLIEQLLPRGLVHIKRTFLAIILSYLYKIQKQFGLSRQSFF